MLSAKFAQSQIKVVDNFLIESHKTKYAVNYLRNILGRGVFPIIINEVVIFTQV